VDVREAHEFELGRAQGAVNVPRSSLEREAAAALPDRERTLLLMCEVGARSRLAAQSLRRLGYRDVRNVEGGFRRWVERGLPVVLETGGLTEPELRRYARHLVIPEVGLEGQKRLKQGSVLCVGAGGLGSPVAIYLAMAGVGRIGIVDGDVVDETNLQRQILHTADRVGARKTDSARAMLAALNPLVEVETYDLRLTSDNVDEILPRYDVVVDGADNFPTRYLVNDACLKHGKPNVHGSVWRFEGQASVFGLRDGPCYRCLYPAPPPPGLVESCADAGVLGVLPGLVGLVQAVETIKLILQVGESLSGRLLVYDALAGSFRELRVKRRADCAWCGRSGSFPDYVDYEGFCAG